MSAEVAQDKVLGRWYRAMGGEGLERKRGDGDWCVVGYIKKHGFREWAINVNPYQDEGYALSSHRSLEEAKAEFLRWARVTDVVEEKGVTQSAPCPECGGKGFVNHDGSKNNAFEGADSDPTKPCPTCKGTGLVYLCEREGET